MVTIKKNFISLSMATILCLNPIIVTADFINDAKNNIEERFENAYENSTSAGKWQRPVGSGSGAINYHSYGSQVFKFKRNTNFEPMFQAQASESGISCNGFSFDAGFLGVMNLDGIEEQLKEAAVAFMWGLLTVFKMTMPNLNAVFEHIQKIVREFQEMLRNACKIGSEVMQKRVGGEGVNLLVGVDKYLEMSDPEDVAESQSSGTSETINTWLDNTLKSSDGGKSQRAITTDAKIMMKLKKMGNGYIGNELTGKMQDKLLLAKELSHCAIGSLNDLFNNTTFTAFEPSNYNDVPTNAVTIAPFEELLIKIRLAFFGDLTPGVDSRRRISNAIGSGLNAVKDKVDVLSNLRMSRIYGVHSSSDFKTFILEGGVVDIPDYQLMILQSPTGTKKDAQGNIMPASSEFATLLLPPKGNQTIKLEFGGFKKESELIVNQLVYDIASSRTMRNNAFFSKQSSFVGVNPGYNLSTSTLPNMLDSNLHEIVKNIAIIEMIEGKETAQTKNMKNQLASINANRLITDFVGNMKNMLTQVKDSVSGTSSKSLILEMSREMESKLEDIKVDIKDFSSDEERVTKKLSNMQKEIKNYLNAKQVN